MEHNDNRLPENLLHIWRQRAVDMRDWGGNEDVARLWERAATELEQALHAAGGETLTLTEAAHHSGLTAAYLGDLVRAGKLPNAGRKHAPRIRLADLPAVRPDVVAPAHPPHRVLSRRVIAEIVAHDTRTRRG